MNQTTFISQLLLSGFAEKFNLTEFGRIFYRSFNLQIGNNPTTPYYVWVRVVTDNIDDIDTYFIRLSTCLPGKNYTESNHTLLLINIFSEDYLLPALQFFNTEFQQIIKRGHVPKNPQERTFSPHNNHPPNLVYPPFHPSQSRRR